MNLKKLKPAPKKEDVTHAMTIKDMIAPAPNFEVKEKHIEMGENFARTFYVIDFPPTPKGNWLSRLYRFKGNLTISTHYEPIPNDNFVKQTERSIQELNTELYGKRTLKLKPSHQIELKNKLDDAQETLEKLLSGDNKNIFNVHMYLHLQASTLDELDKASQRLKIACMRMGLRIAPAESNMLEAFKSVLPTSDNTVPEMTYRNMDTEAASSLFPFDESEIFEETGVIKGKNVKTESLVLVDQKTKPSHNEFIVGMPGMRKTTYMVMDALRKWQQGDRIFAIDPEGEISRMARRIGGQVIKMSPMSKSVVNIMEIKPYMDSANLDKDDDEEEEIMPLLFQKIQRLKIFFNLIKKKMDIVEMAQLEQAIIETYKEKTIEFDTDFRKLEPADYPILEDLYKVIEGDKERFHKLQDFKDVLYMYVYGSNSRMFNGHTNVDLNNDFISIDLKELEDEADSQAAAYYNALSFLWDEITGSNGQWTWLITDECHKIADPDNPRAMKFLYQIYKRIRKYGGGATVATQQVADYLSAVEGTRNYGQAIIGNSYSQMILPMQKKDIEDMRPVLEMSEAEELIISKLVPGQGIYVMGNNRVHMEIHHTREEMEIMDPKIYEKLYGKELFSYAN